MELKAAEIIQSIMQSQNHPTSYLWPLDVRTHTHTYPHECCGNFHGFDIEICLEYRA